MAEILLKAGREDSLARKHPWIFSGAIEKTNGQPGHGDTVEVRASKGGKFLGRAAYSPSSQIKARLWTFGDEAVGEALFRRRLADALALRRDRLAEVGGGCRLVNAESDLLPGVVVDRYAGVLVIQLLAAGAERWRETLASLLRELLPEASCLYERSDAEAREKEGLLPRVGLVWGEEPPDELEIVEDGCRYLVDVRAGHKTGFYLDQRDNRARVAGYAAGREVLNAFSYTGGFGIAALATGAKNVLNIDASAAALELARQNAERNGIAGDAFGCHEGNVFSVLRALRAEERRFDLIVLDPPKFVDSRAHLEKAARGYKDINLLACQLLRPQGMLFTFSCSGLMPGELFQKIVADAALDAGRPAQILHRLGPPSDHPTLLSFPEGTYLKGLACRVI
jgi:23S rRNA (cytosine1962-C5)-methyltransferase